MREIIVALLVLAAAAGLYGAWFPDDLTDGGRVWTLLTTAKFLAAVLAWPMAVGCAVLMLAAARLGRGQLSFWAAVVAVSLTVWSRGPTLPDLFGSGWSADPIRVMSANIYVKSDDPTRLLASVEAVRPDVLLIQEWNPTAADVLLGPLAERFEHHAIADNAGRFDGYAAFSRYPLTARPFGDWRDVVVQRLDVQHPERRLVVLNVHPASVGSVRGIRHNRTQNRFLAELAVAEGATIVAGDFNAPPNSAACRAFDAAGYLSTGSAATWPRGRLPGVSPVWRIDDVRVQAGASVEAAGVAPDTGGDHVAVWADVRPSS